MGADGGHPGTTESNMGKSRVEGWRISPATLSEHLDPAMPELGIPTGKVKEVALMQLCWSGLNYKYGKELQGSRRRAQADLFSTAFPSSPSPKVSISLPRSLA